MTTQIDTPVNVDRNSTIKIIKDNLERRSGKKWSVTGGRGTAWGWITIDAPPARRTWSSRLKANASACQLPEDYESYDTGMPGGYTSPQDREELAALLGLTSAHHQGVNVAASSDYYREYIQRARGVAVTKVARPYWD